MEKRQKLKEIEKMNKKAFFLITIIFLSFFLKGYGTTQERFLQYVGYKNDFLQAIKEEDKETAIQTSSSINAHFQRLILSSRFISPENKRQISEQMNDVFTGPARDLIGNDATVLFADLLIINTQSLKADEKKVRILQTVNRFEQKIIPLLDKGLKKDDFPVKKSVLNFSANLKVQLPTVFVPGFLRFLAPVGKALRILARAAIPIAVMGFLGYLIFGQRRPLLRLDDEKKINKIGKGEKPDTTFKQIAGMKEVKEELMELIEMRQYPTKYEKYGITFPRGVLLAGPPGVGKTMLAKALAHEGGFTFFSAGAAEFQTIYRGAGAVKLRKLFAAAKLAAPSIIFIDEIDGIGRRRHGVGESLNEALIELLNQMDGYVEIKNVLVLAATNRPEDLDEALKRPGRFDRIITIDLPKKEARKAILKLYIEKIHKEYRTVELIENDYLDGLVEKTNKYSGAELRSLINKASLHSLRRKAGKVTDKDINSALEELRKEREARKLKKKKIDWEKLLGKIVSTR
jgi:AAA+ superfamily predicted ATPase